MDKYLLVALVVGACILLVIYTQLAPSGGQKNFKQIVQQAFGRYKVIEKNYTIMICEINHRNEPEELVFIRIAPAQKKNLRISRRMLIATYPKATSVREMRKDFKDYVTERLASTRATTAASARHTAKSIEYSKLGHTA